MNNLIFTLQPAIQATSTPIHFQTLIMDTIVAALRQMVQQELITFRSQLEKDYQEKLVKFREQMERIPAPEARQTTEPEAIASARDQPTQVNYLDFTHGHGNRLTFQQIGEDTWRFVSSNNPKRACYIGAEFHHITCGARGFVTVPHQRLIPNNTKAIKWCGSISSNNKCFIMMGLRPSQRNNGTPGIKAHILGEWGWVCVGGNSTQFQKQPSKDQTPPASKSPKP